MAEKKKRVRTEARKWWPTRGKKTAFGITEWTLFWICFIVVLLVAWEFIYYARHHG